MKCLSSTILVLVVSALVLLTSCATSSNSSAGSHNRQASQLEQNIAERTERYNQTTIPMAEAIMALHAEPADWQSRLKQLRLGLDTVDPSFWKSANLYTIQRELPRLMTEQRLQIEQLNRTDSQQIRAMGWQPPMTSAPEITPRFSVDLR